MLALATLGAAACERAPPAREVVVTPQILDRPLAAMLEAGAPACEIYFYAVLEDCPAATAVQRHLADLPGPQRAAAAETCAAFLSTGDTRRTLLAAGCLERLPAEVITPWLPVAFAALDHGDHDARWAIARGLRRADAAAARLVPQILAYVRGLDREPARASTASTAAYLIETVFGVPDGEGHRTGPESQAWALEALATSRNQQLAALQQLPRIIDKPAACAALVASLRGSNRSIDVLPVVMSTHACDPQLADFFDALVEIVPRDSSDYVVTVLLALDERVTISAALRARAAAALQTRHDAEAPRYGSDEVSQRFLKQFASAADHFRSPRPGPT